MSNGEPVAKVAIPVTSQPASSRFFREKVPPLLVKGMT